MYYSCTGLPKGVLISHANIVAGVGGMSSVSHCAVVCGTPCSASECTVVIVVVYITVVCTIIVYTTIVDVIVLSTIAVSTIVCAHHDIWCIIVANIMVV